MTWSLRQPLVIAAIAASLTAPVAVADEQANKALFKAAEAGNTEGIKQAVADGADLSAHNNKGRTALMIAAREADLATVEALIKAGADVNTTSTVSDDTAVMAAARRGDADIMRAMFEAGARADGRDQNGRTPLMVAAKGGHHEIMKILVDHGAATQTKDRFGWGVADYAKMGGKKTVKHLENLASGGNSQS